MLNPYTSLIKQNDNNSNPKGFNLNTNIQPTVEAKIKDFSNIESGRLSNFGGVSNQKLQNELARGTFDPRSSRSFRDEDFYSVESGSSRRSSQRQSSQRQSNQRQSIQQSGLRSKDDRFSFGPNRSSEPKFYSASSSIRDLRNSRDSRDSRNSQDSSSVRRSLSQSLPGGGHIFPVTPLKPNLNTINNPIFNIDQFGNVLSNQRGPIQIVGGGVGLPISSSNVKDTSNFRGTSNVRDIPVIGSEYNAAMLGIGVGSASSLKSIQQSEGKFKVSPEKYINDGISMPTKSLLTTSSKIDKNKITTDSTVDNFTTILSSLNNPTVGDVKSIMNKIDTLSYDTNYVLDNTIVKDVPKSDIGYLDLISRDFKSLLSPSELGNSYIDYLGDSECLVVGSNTKMRELLGKDKTLITIPSKATIIKPVLLKLYIDNVVVNTFKGESKGGMMIYTIPNAKESKDKEEICTCVEMSKDNICKVKFCSKDNKDNYNTVKAIIDNNEPIYFSKKVDMDDYITTKVSLMMLKDFAACKLTEYLEQVVSIKTMSEGFAISFYEFKQPINNIKYDILAGGVVSYYNLYMKNEDKIGYNISHTSSSFVPFVYMMLNNKPITYPQISDIEYKKDTKPKDGIISKVKNFFGVDTSDTSDTSDVVKDVKRKSKTLNTPVNPIK